MTSEPRPTPYISRLTAIDKVRRLFSAQPEADSIFVTDIFKMQGHEGLPEKHNRRWLSQTLTFLKHYNLVKPVYGPGRKLHRIHLTPEGKRALAETEPANTELAEARPPIATFTGVTLNGEMRRSTTGVTMTSKPYRKYSISRQATIKILRQQLFPEPVLSGPDAESVSVEDLFKRNGREDLDEKRNRKWLSDMLVLFKIYNLVQPVYGIYHGEHGDVKKLYRIQLTPEGKRALARTEPDEITVTETAAPFDIRDQKITVNDAMDIVAKFQSENPDLKVIFEIRLKQHQKS